MENKTVEYTAKIRQAIIDLIQDEDNENHVSIEELSEGNNMTDFIHALGNSAPTMIYNSLTGDEKNNLEFNHLCNALCFQYNTGVDKKDS